MLSTVEMSRLTMAGSSDNLDEVLRLCANLGNVHIKPYSGDTDGITVGTPHPDQFDSEVLKQARSCFFKAGKGCTLGKFSRKGRCHHRNHRKKV